MRVLIFIFLLLSPSAFADSFRTQIHSVERTGKLTIIKFLNGRVAFVSNPRHFPAMKSHASYFQVETDAQGNLKKLKDLTFPPKDERIMSSVPNSFRDYEAAMRYFDHLASTKSLVETPLKAFIVLGLKYIKQYRPVWWFQAAPVIPVKTNGKLQNMVFDVVNRFAPVGITEWSKQFITNKKLQDFELKLSKDATGF